MSRTRTVGGKITEIVGGDYKIYSKGNITYNSNKSITFTGKENGVTFGKPQDPPVIVGKKKIIRIAWMCAELKNEINKAVYGEKVSLLVKTKNYKEGEILSVTIDEIEGKEMIYKGIVNSDGVAELKEKIKIES
jgi:hypothetical protein